eukprot:gene17209-21043_t
MGLEHPEEPVFVLQRRRWVDQRPVLLECNVVLVDWCPELLSADLDTSLTTLLRERFGRVQSRSELLMHAETMNEAQAGLLQVSPGSSSFYLERLNFGEQGQPVEFDQEFWRPDALAVRAEGLIFDCDGTLVDSQHMIVAAMADAYASRNLVVPDRTRVLSIVGLSVHEGFIVLG